VLVAGGIGIAPFPALVTQLRARGDVPILLYGARTQADLPLLAWFTERCTSVRVSTDDGTRGHRGFVTDVLSELLRERAGELHVYACGPEPMLKRVAAMTRGTAAICELSLEAHMACGFGVCLGCVVPTHDGRWGDGGYERVCVEGPIMRAERLAW
jgi:dihydroorotate dehydrogenase electron transfer subunit